MRQEKAELNLGDITRSFPLKLRACISSKELKNWNRQKLNVSTAHYAFSTVTITITTVTRKIRGENVIYIYINKMHLIYKKRDIEKATEDFN